MKHIVRLANRKLAGYLKQVGAADTCTGDSTLHGIVLQDMLVCIGETPVQDRHYGAIQQIYTLLADRGRSLAQ